MLTFEALLVIGVFSFYFYDSLMLLNINELIITKSRKKWSYQLPVFDYQLLRKYPLLPNMASPGTIIFRTFWPGTIKVSNIKEVNIFISILEPVQMLINILLILELIWLPVVVYYYGSGAKLLIIFVAIYLTIIGILIYIYSNRDKLYISKSNFSSLAFEVLACPPFAINIVKKISLNYPDLNNPLMIAKKIFDKASFKSFCIDLSHAVERNIKYIDINSDRYKALNNYLKKLKKEQLIE